MKFDPTAMTWPTRGIACVPHTYGVAFGDDDDDDGDVAAVARPFDNHPNISVVH